MKEGFEDERMGGGFLVAMMKYEGYLESFSGYVWSLKEDENGGVYEIHSLCCV